jgi:hypothetical protein
MTNTSWKTIAGGLLALGLSCSYSAAQVIIPINLPGIRTPIPTQPVRLPYPQLPIRPLPAQLAAPSLLPVQPFVLPKVELPPVVIPTQPRIINPGQTGPAPVAAVMARAMKDGKAPKAAVLDKVFDNFGASAQPAPEPVDLRDDADDAQDSKPLDPHRRVTLPEWELEQDLGIR